MDMDRIRAETPGADKIIHLNKCRAGGIFRNRGADHGLEFSYWGPDLEVGPGAGRRERERDF